MVQSMVAGVESRSPSATRRPCCCCCSTATDAVRLRHAAACAVKRNRSSGADGCVVGDVGRWVRWASDLDVQEQVRVQCRIADEETGQPTRPGPPSAPNEGIPSAALGWLALAGSGLGRFSLGSSGFSLVSGRRECQSGLGQGCCAIVSARHLSRRRSLFGLMVMQGVLLAVCLSVRPSIRPSVRPSVHPPVHPSHRDPGRPRWDGTEAGSHPCASSGRAKEWMAAWLPIGDLGSGSLSR